ncbi:MAG: molybdate transport system substrate-binding protein [Chlamydiales bacterium]|jgi:molybdate transport system substrate-binding protein
MTATGRGRRLLRAVALVSAGLLAHVASPGCAPPDERPELSVFAAASLTDLCADLGAAFEPAAVTFNFAGSNVLARQILAAPEAADVFLSADRAWAQELVERDLTAATPTTVLSNSLVVIGWPGPDGRERQIKRGLDLASLEFSHLALADPEAVPAGRYARAWLESLPAAGGSLWDALESRVAPTLDVRAAMALVETGPEILGIVYRTDARQARRARVLFEVPDHEQPPIAYVAMRLQPNDGTSLAQSFLDFLQTERARDICSAHGFVTVL